MLKNDIVCTLVEKDFFLGASVLLNSLICHGFEGDFIIGTKGSCSSRVSFENKIRLLEQNKHFPKVEIIEIETDWHLANYKAHFLKGILEQNTGTETLVYFDPDIVLNYPWSFMKSWVDGGVALAADVNWHMPMDHPIRKHWGQCIRDSGDQVKNDLNIYFNSGFIGLSKDHIQFVEKWIKYVERYGARNNPLDGKGDIGAWRKGGRWLPFMSPDQDTLNLAAMSSSVPLSTVGPDAMGFTDGDLIIPHAVGAVKPWRAKYILMALNGHGPRRVDKLYWEHANGGLKLFPVSKVWVKRSQVKIAALIARFIRRS